MEVPNTSETTPELDCQHFPGRLFDLCTGQGQDGRPDPSPEAVQMFRAQVASETRGTMVAGREPRSPLSNRPIRMRPPKLSGPGTQFRQLLSEIDLHLPGCEGCQGTMSRMNRAGVEGCKEQRAQFLAEIKSRAKSVNFSKRLTAAWTAVQTGLCWSLNPLDPIGSLYDLAVSRAEKQDASQAPSE